MKPAPNFQLTLPFKNAQEVEDLAEAYGYENDDSARRAGKRLWRRVGNIHEVLEINKWKNPKNRNLSPLRENDTDEVLFRLSSARRMCKDQYWMAALDLLVGLRGINYPTATALLAMLLPDSFPIIDFRAWRSCTGELRTNFDARRTRTYVESCMFWSSELALDLRKLDRALWRLDDERFGKRRKAA